MNNAQAINEDKQKKKDKVDRIVSFSLGTTANFTFTQILFFIQFNLMTYSKDSAHYRTPSYNMSICAFFSEKKNNSH